MQMTVGIVVEQILSETCKMLLRSVDVRKGEEVLVCGGGSFIVIVVQAQNLF